MDIKYGSNISSATAMHICRTLLLADNIQIHTYKRYSMYSLNDVPTYMCVCDGGCVG